MKGEICINYVAEIVAWIVTGLVAAYAIYITKSDFALFALFIPIMFRNSSENKKKKERED